MARKKLSDDQRASKREEILDAAMGIFEKEGGLEAVSFRSLASAMGWSYSAPYRYFSSKEELVNAMRARAYRWIENAMLEAIEGETTANDQLNALAAAYIRSGIERPHRYALMFFNLDNTEVAKHSLELKTAKRDALDVCTRAIRAGQESGEFPKTVDPLTASHIFWSGAHGLVSLQVAGQLVMGRDLEELIPTLIQTLRLGLDHFEISPDLNQESA